MDYVASADCFGARRLRPLNAAAVAWTVAGSAASHGGISIARRRTMQAGLGSFELDSTADPPTPLSRVSGTSRRCGRIRKHRPRRAIVPRGRRRPLVHRTIAFVLRPVCVPRVPWRRSSARRARACGLPRTRWRRLSADRLRLCPPMTSSCSRQECRGPPRGRGGARTPSVSSSTSYSALRLTSWWPTRDRGRLRTPEEMGQDHGKSEGAARARGVDPPCAAPILMPIFGAMSDEENESMADRWAALLANAASDTDAEVPPRFPSIFATSRLRRRDSSTRCTTRPPSARSTLLTSSD